LYTHATVWLRHGCRTFTVTVCLPLPAFDCRFTVGFAVDVRLRYSPAVTTRLIHVPVYRLPAVTLLPAVLTVRCVLHVGSTTVISFGLLITRAATHVLRHFITYAIFYGYQRYGLFMPVYADDIPFATHRLLFPYRRLLHVTCRCYDMLPFPPRVAVCSTVGLPYPTCSVILPVATPSTC